MTSGVYAIVNVVNGKRYVGSAVNLTRRWYLHQYDLRRGAHPNRHLQNAWAKYGPDAFRFEVIEECGPEMLIDKEQRFLDRFQPEYNIARTAGSSQGIFPTSAARVRMSEAQRLRFERNPGVRTMGTRAKISKSLRAYHERCAMSPETKAKISVALRGIPPNANQRAALAKGRLPGKRYTPERMAKLQAGYKAWREANGGGHPTEQEKADQSTRMKAWWAAKRAEERGAE